MQVFVVIGKVTFKTTICNNFDFVRAPIRKVVLGLQLILCLETIEVTRLNAKL